MIKLHFDMSDVAKMAQHLGAVQDQLPYVMALALNEAADVTRSFLIQATWPQHVQQRNKSFIAASLTTRQARANKRDLSVEIYDRLDRGNLEMQAKGGQRTPHGGSNLAIPVSTVTRTSRGVPQRFKPKNLGERAVRKGDALYAKDAKGRLRLLYILKPRTPIPKRVPFYEDFTLSMERELRRAIPLAVARAMSTRR